MQNSTRTWGIIAALIVLSLIGLAIFMRPMAGAPSSTATSTATTTDSTVAHDGITGTGDFTVSSDAAELNIPDFRAPIRFSAGISSEVRSALEKAVGTLKDRLAKDTFDLKSWIDLGTVRKMGGDYKGAEVAWKFVTEASPSHTLAYNNLGDLYMNFLKDYPKAEAMYLAAIKLSPAEANPYRELSALYTNFYKKGTTAAEDILKKGVATAPESVDLHVLLARYYKAAGRTAEAKTQYEAAIAAANKAGEVQVAAQLKAEAGL